MVETQATLVGHQPPSRRDESRWFVAYVRSRHEKGVAEQLERRNMESFLPLWRAVRRWKYCRKRVDLPLFPGYLFVRISVEDRLEVLRLSGVVRLVGFGEAPTEIPERDVQVLRSGLQNNFVAEPHPYLKAGQKVRVRCGPLVGAEGMLIRKKGDVRLVLSFDANLRAVAVEVDSCDVEPMSRSEHCYHTKFRQSVDANLQVKGRSLHGTSR